MITIESLPGFIPQNKINVVISEKNVFISEVIIYYTTDKKNKTLLISEAVNDTEFSFTHQVEFGKSYQYDVLVNKQIRVAYTDFEDPSNPNNIISANKKYWQDNWTLSEGLVMGADGLISGTGSLVAKKEYVNNLNSKGLDILDFTAWIGNGGSKDGYNSYTLEYENKVVNGNQTKVAKKKLDTSWDNITINFQAGEATKVNRYIYFTKAWDYTKNLSARFWMYFNKKDLAASTEERRARKELKYFKDKVEAFDLKLYFNRSATDIYTYGLSPTQASLNNSKLGLLENVKPALKMTSLIISLKNGARIRPDFVGQIVQGRQVTMFKYENIASETLTKTIDIKDEPFLDYGIIMDDKGVGFRFKRYEANGVLDSDAYSYESTSNFLDIEGNEFPLVYVSDHVKKNPSTAITIFTDNLFYRDRLRNNVFKSNFIYIFMPKSWNYQLKSGFYAYSQVVEQRIPNSVDYYEFRIEGARQVSKDIGITPKWTYARLLEETSKYAKVMESYRDYEDLAISPSGGEILGQKD